MNMLVEQSFERMLDNTAKRAIRLAERSALDNPVDLPIAAIALRGAMIAGEGTALDQKLQQPHMHAEVAALGRARHNHIDPTILVSTAEPCVKCQIAIAAVESIETVAFVVPRWMLEAKKLVNPGKPIDPDSLPYNVIQLDDPEQIKKALEPYDFTQRTPATNGVEAVTKVDSDAFRAHLAERPSAI
ncbi:hypothetical protein EPN95_02085 [Patescibacteria group bacterium]|nr:MAG: hypothetical protein EPN95_02085 [Patescibacteria group bacterium]